MKICSLCSGSKGNSYYIETASSKMLFDAGKNLKYITSSLSLINKKLKDLNYIFITHTHSDHISALKNILKNSNAYLCISQKMFYLLDDLKDFDRLIIFEDEISLGDVVIKSLKSSHDAEDSRNYVIEANGKKISYITDTGYVKERQFKYFYDSDVILMESNHDIELLDKGPYPAWLKARVRSDEGHLSNNQAGFYLSKLIGPNTKCVKLIHLSDKNNDPEVALNTVYNILNDYEVEFNNITYAEQDDISEVIEV